MPDPFSTIPPACPRCGAEAREVSTLGLCPACLLAAGKSAPAASADAQVGPYLILGKLGEGGFGTVYLAEQSRPVEREVALKILKPGVASEDAILRFAAERQTLARLEHPNIATFFDAGETDDGRPYFVMELVEGAPVTEYCDQKKLNVRQRLELFVDICSAVQHAHQKGVIHRDLKPQNILVGEVDGRPVPKVIDFGVAKVLEPRHPGDPGTTRVASIIGTPAYMSPEQAGGRLGEVDTRSDVYALGVLLYELLSGHLPFDSERLRQAGAAALEYILGGEDPPPPSARAGETASLRSTTAQKLGNQIRGDLDWIVARAMEKTPDRRYATVSGLASDIRRHLAGETVEAGPPDFRYRAGKFVRKHRAALTSAALILTALVAGTIVSTLQAIRATRAETAAEAEATRATRAEATAREEAARATAAVTFLQQDILQQADPDKNTNRDFTLREAIDLGAPLIDERFAGRPDIAAFLHGTLSSVYQNLGEIPAAIAQATRAVELVEPERSTRPLDFSNALVNLGSIHLIQHDLPAARAVFEGGLNEFARTDGHPRQAKALEYEGMLLTEEQRYAEAEPVLQKALAAATRDDGAVSEKAASLQGLLGTLYTYTGRHDEAIAAMESALSLYRELRPAGSINVLRAQEALARSYGNAGQYDKAIPLLRETLSASADTLGPEHPDVIAQKNTLAYHLDDMGQVAEAETLLREVIAPGTASGSYSGQQLMAMGNLALMVDNKGDVAEAKALYEAAITGQKSLYGENAPQVLTNEFNYGIHLREAGDPAAAEVIFRRVYAGHVALGGRENQNALHTGNSLARLLFHSGQQTEAIAFLREALRDLPPLTGYAEESRAALAATLTSALESADDPDALRTHLLEHVLESPADTSVWLQLAPSAGPAAPLGLAVGLAGLEKSGGLAPLTVLSALPPPLVPAGAAWHYWDRAEAPPADWFSSGFDAAAWPAGPSELGYGDGDEATVLGFGDDPENKPLSACFLLDFPAPPAGAAPVLLLACDDGALVRLNGQEIARLHLPEGAITFQTPATLSAAGAQEGGFALIPLPPALLRPDKNNLAISVHQDRPASSDLTCLPVVLAGLPPLDLPPDLATAFPGHPEAAALLTVHRHLAAGDRPAAVSALAPLLQAHPDATALHEYADSLRE